MIGFCRCGFGATVGPPVVAAIGGMSAILECVLLRVALISIKSDNSFRTYSGARIKVGAKPIAMLP